MADRASTRDVVPGFGGAVRARRLAAGLTLVELGERVGVHNASISRVERGNRSISLRLALDVARALGVGVDTLVRDAARIAAAGSE